MNKTRPLATALLLALLLVLPGCFTFGLWGFEPQTETDAQGREQNVLVYDEQTQWSWADLGLRVLLTPLACGLDVLTAPVQAWFWATDDDTASGDCSNR